MKYSEGQKQTGVGQNALAHASSSRLRRGQNVGRLAASGLTLYYPLEPCPMCAGRVIQRGSIAYASALMMKSGACGQRSEFIRIQIQSSTGCEGDSAQVCSAMLSRFSIFAKIAIVHFSLDMKYGRTPHFRCGTQPDIHDFTINHF
jgi:tRNA(Arg) A34 adenosine deaminase TadA